MVLKIQNVLAYLKYDAQFIDFNEDFVMDADEDEAVVLRFLRGGLYVVYVVDQDDRLNYVQNYHLKRFGIEVEELHQMALKNLTNYVADKVKFQKRGPIFSSFVDGNFEASLALLDSIWDDKVKPLIPNQVVLAIPTRDVLGFCDSGSKEGIATLKEVIRRTLVDPDHPLAPSLFIRRNGTWLPYQES